MGPGMLLKSILQGSFSLIIFGWTQVLMDIQPLIGLLLGSDTLHGVSHTYIGSTLIAVVACITGKYFAEYCLVATKEMVAIGINWHTLRRYNFPRVFDPMRVQAVITVRWWVALSSALLGAYTHVGLDSLMHYDIRPFYPYSEKNVLLSLISIDQLYAFCLYTGLTGVVVFLLMQSIRSRRR
jgi:hypothetical protein